MIASKRSCWIPLNNSGGSITNAGSAHAGVARTSTASTILTARCSTTAETVPAETADMDVETVDTLPVTEETDDGIVVIQFCAVGRCLLRSLIFFWKINYVL